MKEVREENGGEKKSPLGGVLGFHRHRGTGGVGRNWDIGGGRYIQEIDVCDSRDNDVCVNNIRLPTSSSEAFGKMR